MQQFELSSIKSMTILNYYEQCGQQQQNKYQIIMNIMNQSNSFSKPSLQGLQKQKLLFFNHKSLQKEQDRFNSISRKEFSSKKTQINLKQYTNKFLRSNNAYQQKQNQKFTHFNRLYLFTRKNKALRQLKQKRFVTCITQPIGQNQQSQNIENISSHDKISRFSHQRKHNYSQFDAYCSNNQNRQASILKELCIDENNFAIIKNMNRGIIQLKRLPILEKEKISTSRALQKYAKILKQDGFNAHASHNFDKNQLQKYRSFQSNDENNQQIRLTTKKLKSQIQLKPQKSYLKKMRVQTKQRENNKEEDQQFDLKGW